MIKRAITAWICQLLASVCLSSLAFAQYSPYRFDHWTTDNGLPQNTVNRVIQTRDGYLWMTTYDGLVRFDGLRFVVFDKSNTPGINSNRLVGLVEDRDGSLLIGAQGAGLTRYHRGTFKSYTTADGLPADDLAGMFLDMSGSLVINTRKGPVYLQDGAIVPAPLQNQRREFYRTPSGAVVTMDGDRLRHVKDGRSTYYSLKPARTFPGLFFTEDRQGRLWLGDGSDLYFLHDGEVTRFPEVSSLRPECEDEDGGIWFSSTCPEGGYPLRFKDGKFTTFSEADGIRKATINSIVTDREGSIWFATTRGLFRARKRFLTAYSTANGLASNEAYPLTQSRDGQIWVGTTRGLNRVSLVDGTFESSAPLASDTNVQALLADDSGRVWVGNLNGVTRLAGGRTEVIAALLKRGTVHDIEPARDGSYWVGTRNGLFRVQGDDVVAQYTATDGLPGDDVVAIHEDRHGALWLGTQGGLARLQDGKFAAYTVADGLAGASVRTIHEDAEGTLWIGTYDAGLSRFKDGKFFTYRTEQGLFNNGVFQILEDRRGYFWINCNKGIYRVSRRDLNELAEGRISRVHSVPFGKDDGMLDTEGNGGRQPAGFKAADGKLWFPTMGGVVVIDPDAAPVNSLPPPAMIESVAIERGMVDYSQGVTVAPGRRDLEIAYTGVSLIRSERVTFKYRLDGLDTKWVDAGTRRAAYFPYLAPGTYTFHVVAANSDGVWNTEGASLRIVVQAPFYRTAWFITLMVIGVALVGVQAYRSRLAQWRQRQEEQEAFSRRLIESQEGERKRIAADLHDGLGQSLLVIKNRALVGGLSPEDAGTSKEQFDEISLTASQAIEEARRIAYDLRPYHLDRLGLTQSLEEMVERVAGSTTTRFQVNIPLLDGVFDNEGEAIFYRIVQESLSNIVKHSQAAEASIAIQREEDSITLIVRDNGKGFKASQRHDAQSGFGLIGLAERVRMLAGHYTLESAPNQGTTITMTFPVLT